MTSTLAAAFLAASLSAAPTDTGKDVQTRAQVNEYLGSDDITPERWRALGTKALPFLAKTAMDPDSSPGRRVKAIHAITVVGSDADAQMLLDLARSEAEPAVIRIVALRDGLRLLPARKRLGAVRPMLGQARSVRVRAAAAETMTRLSRGQCSVVRAQLEKERSKDQKLYQRALRRCPKPSPEPVAPAAAAPREAAPLPEPPAAPPPTEAAAEPPAAAPTR